MLSLTCFAASSSRPSVIESANDFRTASGLRSPAPPTCASRRSCWNFLKAGLDSSSLLFISFKPLNLLTVFSISSELAPASLSDCFMSLTAPSNSPSERVLAAPLRATFNTSAERSKLVPPDSPSVDVLDIKAVVPASLSANFCIPKLSDSIYFICFS